METLHRDTQMQHVRQIQLSLLYTGQLWGVTTDFQQAGYNADPRTRTLQDHQTQQASTQNLMVDCNWEMWFTGRHSTLGCLAGLAEISPLPTI